MKNLDLWVSVEKTDPNMTKLVKFGREFTAIDPYYQLKRATEKFGSYGSTWGLFDIKYDFEALKELGEVFMTATFKYPGGEFPISNSISLFADAKRTKPDPEFAKKIETNTISKALSKLGFNTDVYMGKFEDNAYVQARYTEEALSTISDEQYDELNDLLVDANADEKKFFDWFGISNLKELKKSDFMKVKQALLKKIGTKK